MRPGLIVIIAAVAAIMAAIAAVPRCEPITDGWRELVHSEWHGRLCQVSP